MDVKEYRRQYEADVSRAAAEVRGPDGRPGFAFRGTSDTLDSDIIRDLKVLGNAAAEASVRRSALIRLKAKRFLGPRFAPYRADFLGLLRKLLTPGEDLVLLTEAAEVLASEKDRQTQDLLRRGLKNPAAALVPAAEALEFLGYDDHEDAGRLAQEVLRSSADLDAREAALRVLGTSAEASDIFAAIMTDKSEAKSLRALGAIGLSRLDPVRFAEAAAKIVFDDGDYSDIRATSLGALLRSPELGGRIDQLLAEGIRSLPTGSVPAALRSAIVHFLQHES